MVLVSYFEVKSPKRGAKLRLDASFFVIGRGERIPIFHDDPSISREHAAVVIKKSGVRVRDLGSKNGVLLNGEPLGRYAEVDLRPGDSLRVGATTLVLREGEPPVAAPKPPEPSEPATTQPFAKVIPPPPETVEDLSTLETKGVAPPPTTSSDDEDDAEAAPQLE